MKIVEDNEGVRIEGKGSERARIAYASEQDGRLEITAWSRAWRPGSRERKRWFDESEERYET